MGSFILFRRSKNGIGQVICVREFNKTEVKCKEKIGQKLSFFVIHYHFHFRVFGEFNQRGGKCEEKIEQKLSFSAFTFTFR